MSTNVEQVKQVVLQLGAMAHPTRLAMLLGLCSSACNVNSIWRQLGISQPLASQHLRKMEKAGVVKGVRRGQQICYEIQDPQVRSLLKHLCKIYNLKIPVSRKEEQS